MVSDYLEFLSNYQYQTSAVTTGINITSLTFVKLINHD